MGSNHSALRGLKLNLCVKCGGSALTIWITGLIQGRYLTVPGRQVLRLWVKDISTCIPLWETIPPKTIFGLLRWQGSRGLKIPMLTLTLKQNVHSYPFTIHAKDVSCPSQSTFQRRISYCSELNPATEMHVGTDLKCGSFHKTKSLTATPGCKFVLESFICYQRVHRMKRTKISVSHYTESGNLRVNATQDFYPKQEFLSSPGTEAWLLSMTDFNFHFKTNLF